MKIELLKKSLIFLTTIFLASLLACGGGGGGNEEKEGTPTPTPTPGETPSPTATPVMDQRLSISSAAPGKSEGNARFTEFATVDLSAQRLRSRATVNLSAAGETRSAKAIAYAQFTARANSGALRASINWKGTLLSGINLSSSTEMIVTLRVRELNPNGSLGSEIFARQLERDGIGSGLKALEVLNLEDGIDQAYELNMKVGQPYRIQVDLECKLKVNVISFALVDCNAESADRGVFVNDLEIMY